MYNRLWWGKCGGQKTSNWSISAEQGSIHLTLTQESGSRQGQKKKNTKDHNVNFLRFGNGLDDKCCGKGKVTETKKQMP